MSLVVVAVCVHVCKVHLVFHFIIRFTSPLFMSYWRTFMFGGIYDGQIPPHLRFKKYILSSKINVIFFSNKKNFAYVKKKF